MRSHQGRHRRRRRDGRRRVRPGRRPRRHRRPSTQRSAVSPPPSATPPSSPPTPSTEPSKASVLGAEPRPRPGGRRWPPGGALPKFATEAGHLLPARGSRNVRRRRQRRRRPARARGGSRGRRRSRSSSGPTPRPTAPRPAARRRRCSAPGRSRTRSGIPHFTLDLEEDFRRRVVDRFIGGYAEGSTPNPCILCNGEVRLAAMVDLAERLGAERLLTGHYARIVEDGEGSLLATAADSGEGPELHARGAAAGAARARSASRSPS